MKKQTLLAKLDQMKVDYAFYYSDRKSTPFFQANAHLFRSASIIKVPILLAWLELEKAGLVDRYKMCQLDDEPQVSGAGFASAVFHPPNCFCRCAVDDDRHLG